MRMMYVICTTALIVLSAFALLGNAAGQGGAQATVKTIWDGVYTSAQANRGQDVYDKSCAECHQADLSGGGDEASAVLRGGDFFARWNNKALGELYRAVSIGMPKNAPGSLKRDAYVDIVAFLLKKNQVPAADTDMTSDLKKLDQILIIDNPR